MIQKASCLDVSVSKGQLPGMHCIYSSADLLLMKSTQNQDPDIILLLVSAINYATSPLLKQMPGPWFQHKGKGRAWINMLSTSFSNM